MRPRRFHVVAVGTGIANVRIGQSNNLPAVGRVRQNFLVAGHCRIEDDLANCLAFGADRNAAEDGPVLQVPEQRAYSNSNP